MLVDSIFDAGITLSRLMCERTVEKFWVGPHSGTVLFWFVDFNKAFGADHTTDIRDLLVILRFVSGNKKAFQVHEISNKNYLL